MDKIRKFLVFKLMDNEFAFDILQVERILGYVEPIRIPESPDYVGGVIKYQEEIIPVIDLCKRLSIFDESVKKDRKIIITKQNEKNIGMIVDMVSEVIDISDDKIDNTPDIVRDISNEYVKGIIKLNDRIIIFLDTEKVLSKEQIIEMESITE